MFPFFTNLPEDVITNTTHWLTDDTDTPAAAANIINARLSTFYEAVYSGARGASYVNWSGARTRVWNLGDAPPRQPVYDEIMPITVALTNSQLPTEVAVVVSYHAAPVSGVPPARLRNRFYLGGFSTGVMALSAANAFPTIAVQAQEQIAAAAAALLAANTAEISWVTASSASGLTITSQIQGGWVDNSPDTQRRRSVEATGRELWP